jgi:hypothetical protein
MLASPREVFRELEVIRPEQQIAFAMAMSL